MNRATDRRLRASGAFTLIELVVVIAVLAILAGVAIPKFVSSSGIDLTGGTAVTVLSPEAKKALDKAAVGTRRIRLFSAEATVDVDASAKAEAQNSVKED